MATKIKKANSNTIPSPYILSIADISYTPNIPEPSFRIPPKIIKAPTPDKSKVTLLNAMKNALINKDNDSFIWCLSQNDSTLISDTVRSMDGDVLALFMNKVVDLFQSSNLSKKNITIWMNQILQMHKYKLLSMEKSTIENLIKIKNQIDNYVKYYTLFKRIGKKVDLVSSKILKKENDEDDNKQNVPALIYAESDDEKESEGIKNLKQKGFVEAESEEDSEDVSMEVEKSEEDDFDVDMDNNEEEEDEDEDKQQITKDNMSESESESN